MTLLNRAGAVLTVLTLAACAGPGHAPTTPAGGVDADAMALHRRIITFDAHLDIPFDFMAGDKDAGRATAMQIDLPKMDAGALDGAAFAVFVPQAKLGQAEYAQARKGADDKLAALEKMFAAYPDRIGLARTAKEAESLVAGGKHFALISVMNAYPFGEDLSWLRDWHARGLRMVAFTHAGHNQYADSNRPLDRLGDEPFRHGGLSDLGKKAIAEMNRLGIIVDVSQITPAAVLQAINLSTAPVVASHVGVKDVVATERNLSATEMRAIAKSGGMIGIVAFNIYLKAPSAEQNADLAGIERNYGLKAFTEARAKLKGEQLAAFMAEMDAYRDRWPGATVADLAASIDAAVKLVGIDHVGVSTDLEHGGGVVGYKTAAEAPALTAELMKLGYSERDIGKIWSGNFFRVWRAVEKAAGK
ncbi:MAG: membrane dipeptidase [Rhodospirillaceae bacterium]|nr:membrane dipeptidase [Rhodospirillaceae bacterium]